MTEPPQSMWLTETNGEYPSDDQGLRGWQAVWLRPLPPPTPFTFEIEWRRLGVQPASTAIDGAAIVRAAEAATPLWD